MRRIFLFQTIATGICILFGRRAAKGASLNLAQDRQDPNRIVGKWHLLDGKADEVNIPQHRMDLVFKVEREQLKGAILNRNNGAEIPLANVKFDGLTLKLQMQSPDNNDQTTAPTLVMTMAGDKLEGYWMKSETEKMGPMLKLIKLR